MAKDIIHIPVKNALENHGWTITDDPYTVQYAEFTMYADLAAERMIAAQRGTEKIAVEIKSFIGRSAVQDVKEALGPYVMYQTYLAEIEPDRKLYLAISTKAYHDIFSLEAVQLLVQRFTIAIIVVNIEREEIVTWID
ncbi:XisH family protein [Candidatus Poribacteria bacterium]|nr:XisH family protein [Candidatus Poribacteria bacterium]